MCRCPSCGELYHRPVFLLSVPAWGGFLSVELKSKNKISAFFKCFRRFDYVDCVLTVNDLIDHSDYEQFKKVCSASHSLYHLLPPYRTSDLHLCGDPSRLPEYYTYLHKNLFIVRSSCEYIKSYRIVIILLMSCLLFVLFLYLLCLYFSCCVYYCAIVLMCVCRILIKIIYLLSSWKHYGNVLHLRCLQQAPPWRNCRFVHMSFTCTPTSPHIFVTSVVRCSLVSWNRVSNVKVCVSSAVLCIQHNMMFQSEILCAIPSQSI